MPKGLLSISTLICERVLREAESDLMSAIRIVDVFFAPELPSDDRPVAVHFSILIIGRVEPDIVEHTIELKLKSPDGTIHSMGQGPQRIAFGPTKIPGSPAGFNVVVEIGITAKTLGMYRLLVYVDGEEVSANPFSLLEKPTQPAAKS